MHPGAMKVGHWKLVNNLLRPRGSGKARHQLEGYIFLKKLFLEELTAATTSCVSKFYWSILEYFRLGFGWSAVSECGVPDIFFWHGGVTLK